MKPITKFSPLAAAFASVLGAFSLAAAPGDLDPAFLNNIGAGITGSAYPEAFPHGTVQALGLQPDGKILVGSIHSRFNNTGELTALKRLNADGTFDNAFAPNNAWANGPHQSNPADASEVNTILVNPDGSFYIGGVFNRYGAEASTRWLIARVNADGTTDAGFVPATLNQFGFGRFVQSIARQADGKILVGGAFSVSGRGNLVRLDPATGALDSSFNASVLFSSNYVVDSVAVAPDGRIYASGQLSGKPFVYRFFSDGSRDFGFAPPIADDFGRINRVLVLPDGRVLIGGNLALNAPHDGIKFLSCLTESGAVDTTFQANLGAGPNGWVGGALKLMPDGRILASGIFNQISGQPISSIMILNLNGTRDPGFTPLPYESDRETYLTHIYDAVVQPDGKIVAGGRFERITDPGFDIRNLVRFEGDAAAGAGSIRLTSASHVTTETAGVYRVPVARLPGISGAVGISLAVGGGTAVAGTDYTAVSGTLSWANGEGGVKYIDIPILTDAVKDGDKTVNITLSAPTGGATLGTPSTATLLIRDANATPVITAQPQGGSVDQGETFTFSVSFESVVSVTLQWQRNTGSGFQDIPGASSTTYSLAANPETDAGSYRVVIQSANGNVTSDAAALQVTIPPGTVLPFNLPGLSVGNIMAGAVDLQGRTVLLGVSGAARILTDGTLDAGFSLTYNSTPTGIVVLDDGRYLISGFFTTVNGTTIRGVARINSNGSLDAGFNLNLGYFVQTLALGAGGKIYVGGASGSGNGLRRYLSDGTLDNTFTATGIGTGVSNGYVWAVRELGDGKVLVAHQFQSGFSTTYRLDRLTGTGAIDATFNTPVLPLSVQAIELLPDGRIVVGGPFATINGENIARLAILSADGVLDTSFAPPEPPNSSVLGIRHLDGRLVVWGGFTQVGPRAIRGIARYSLDGSVDETFKIGAGANNTVNVMLLTEVGDYFLAGNFTTLKGQSRNRVGIVMAGAPPVAFVPATVTVIEANTTVTLTLRRLGPAEGAASITFQTVNGTAIAGTDYQSANGTISWADGDSADKTFQITILNNSTIEATRHFSVVLSNPVGNILPSGSATVYILDDDTFPDFTSHPEGARVFENESFTVMAVVSSPTPVAYQWFLNGDPVTGAESSSHTVNSATLAHGGAYTLKVTNPAGTVESNPAEIVVLPDPARADAEFALAPALNAAPNVLLPISGGGAYVGGNFSTVNGGSTHRYLIRVTETGALDTSFTATPNGEVKALAWLPDGSLIVGGNFTQVGAVNSARLARILPDGTVDSTFATNLGSGANQVVNSIAITPQGRIVAGGNFTLFNNAAGTAYVTVLNADGTRDPLFSSQANNTVTAVAVQPDGLILLGGTFTYQAAVRHVRVLPNGQRDFGYQPTIIAATTIINRIGILADGRIILAGANMGSPSTSGLFALNADGSTDRNISTGVHLDALQQWNGQVLTLYSTSTPYLWLRNLDATFTPDTGFNTPLSFNNTVTAMAIDEEGGIWAGGNFTQFRGETVNRIVRLHGKPVDIEILRQPVPTTVPAGGTLALTVEAIGTAPLSYQWFKGGEPLSNGGRIAGATSANLSISNMSATDEGEYHVEATNIHGTRASVMVDVRLLGAPVVVVEPEESLVVLQGQNFALEAVVVAATPAEYVWTRDGEIVSNNSRISGAGTARLVVTDAQVADNGAYVLTITNASGNDATVPALVTVVPPPAEKHATFASLSLNSGAVQDFLPLPGGRMLVATSAGTLSGGTGGSSSTSRLVLVLADGTVETPIASFTAGTVTRMALHPDGRILLLGTFTSILGEQRPGLARLNADFTLDHAFNPEEAPPLTATVLAGDSQGRVLLGGTFLPYPGTQSHYLVRLRADGRADNTFAADVGSQVREIIVLPGDQYLVGGASNSFLPGSRAAGILNADGTVASTFPVTSTQTLAVDAQGRVYMGFTGAPRVARYSAEGVVDSDFATQVSAVGISGSVEKIVVQENGRIVLMGGFTSPRARLIRLLEDGSLDLLFDTGTGLSSTSTYPAATDAFGRVWVGGNFTSYNSVSTLRIAVLNGDAVNLGFVTPPIAVDVEPDGTALFNVTATGTSAIGYQWFKGDELLTNTGNISGATTATLSIANASAADAGLYRVEISNASGERSSAPVALNLLGAPEFTQVSQGGAFEIAISRALGATLRGVAPLTLQWFKGETLLADGADYAGTGTDTLRILNPRETHGGTYRLVATNSQGTEDVSITVQFFRAPAKVDPDVPNITSLGGNPTALLFLPDGSRLLGGDFTTVNWTGGSASRQGLALIRADGTVDITAPIVRAGTATSSTGGVRALAIDSQGRIYVGGTMTQLNGAGDSNLTINRLIRLVFDPVDSRWERDPSFDIGTGPAGEVRTLAVDAEDRLLVGGAFNAFAGAAGTAYLCRLNQNGSVDDSFTSPASNTVTQIILLPDGKLLVVGSIGGTTISRLTATGGIDGGFSATYTSVGRALALPDGKVIISRSAFPNFKRLNADGSEDNTFPATINANPASQAFTAMARQANGRLLLGGNFTSYDTALINRFARTTANGAFDASFDIGSGFSGGINFIEIDSEGRIHVGGVFTTYRDVNVPRYVILNGNPPSAPAEGFDSWAAENNLPPGQDGPTDDPSGHGILNIVVYALGGNPLEDNTARLPATTDVLHNAQIYPGVQFTRNKNAIGVRIEVNASTGVTFETPADYVETVEDLGNGVERVTLRATQPLPNLTTFFFHVKFVGN